MNSLDGTSDVRSAKTPNYAKIGKKVFVKACLNNDMDFLKSFFRNCYGRFRLSLDKAFILACEMGSIELVRWVVKDSGKGKQIEDFIDAFLWSCLEGNLEVAMYLFANVDKVKRFVVEEAEYDGDDKSLNNAFPLLYACESGNLLLVKWLVCVCGVDVDRRGIDDYQGSSLGKAIELQHFEVAKWLANNACADAQDFLYIAFYYYRSTPLDLVEFAVNECGASLNKVVREDRKCAFLHRAVSGSEISNFEEVEFLIDECQADPNTCFGLISTRKYPDPTYGTPLMKACYHANWQMVHFLLKKGADVNHSVSRRGDTALHWAAKKNDMETVRFLVEECSAKIQPSAVLIEASRHKNWQMVHFFLKHGADVDEPSFSNGETALHWAAENNKLDSLCFLMKECGADVNKKNTDGCTPLFHAFRNACSLPICEALLQYGAKVNEKSYDGSTPLIVATKRNSLEAVKLLVNKHGADVNHQDSKGWTPLFYACQIVSVSMVQYYLELPCINLAKKNKDGITVGKFTQSHLEDNSDYDSSDMDELQRIISLIEARQTRLPKLLKYLTEQGWWEDERNRHRQRQSSRRSTEQGRDVTPPEHEEDKHEKSAKKQRSS